MPLRTPETTQPVDFRGAEAPRPPAPEWTEAWGAAERTTIDLWTDSIRGRKAGKYGELAEALGELGISRESLERGDITDDVFGYKFTIYDDLLDNQKIFDAAKAAGIGDLPATKEEFDDVILGRDGERSLDLATLSRVEGVGPSLAVFGAMAMGDMADSDLGPFQFMVGGLQKSIIRAMFMEGGLVALEEAYKQPERIRNRKQFGIDTTWEDVGTDIGGAFIGGALMTGLGHAGSKAGSAGLGVIRNGFERSVAVNWDKLPARLQERWKGDLPDVETPEYDILIADTAEEMIGEAYMSPTERDALLVFRREAEIKAGSPFVGNGAGVQMHGDLMAAAFGRLMADNPVQARLAPALPTAPIRTGSRRAGLKRGTAIGSEVVPGDAQARFMGRVRRAESSGDDNVRNPRSSATGRYQFIDPTWLSYYKRRFGSGGLSDKQIVAKRGDGRLQDVLMADLTADNAAFLRKRGEPVTEGNLYLVHFAGQGGARKLFDADPNAPVARVLGSTVVNANPHLKGMTAQDVINWASRAMGQKGAPRAGARVEIAEHVGEADFRTQLQDELDAVNARIGELNAAREGDEGLGQALDDIGGDIPSPIADAEFHARDPDLPEPEAPEPRAFDPSAPPAETLALLPALRAIERDRGRSLNQIDAIAEELGASPAEIREGLLALTADGTITANKKTGNFMRKREAVDEAELLEFIAKRGGIRDDEGHGLGLVGLSKKERREIPRSAEARIQKERAGRGRRDWQRMTRSQGPLLRHEGRSIDEIGEALWEEGWFGPSNSTPRPTTAQVLDLIEQRIQSGKATFPPGHEASGSATAPSPRSLAEMGDEELQFEMAAIADTAMNEFGFEAGELDADFLEYAARLRWRSEGGMDDAQAFLRAVNDYAHSVKIEAFDRSGKIDYDDTHYDWPQNDTPFQAENIRYEDDWRGFEPARDFAEAGADSRTIADPDAGARLAELTPEERTPFLDPDSPQTKAQADSLEHDARMWVDEIDPSDPAIAARQAEEVQLRADAPMRGENITGEAQDGTMGAPLFDAADAPEFLLDVDAGSRSLRDVLNEIDDEAADLKTIRDCL